jgi:hypothetical protein
MATAATGAIQARDPRERRYRFERQKETALADDDNRDLKRRRDTKA